MRTLAKIEAAADALPESEQEKLIQHLSTRLLRCSDQSVSKRRLPLVPATGRLITQQEIDDAAIAE